MPTFSFRRISFVAAFSLVLLVACGDSDEADSPMSNSADSILQFVPADTPYVFATTGDAPDDVYDKLRPQIDATLSAYHKIIRAVAENAYAEARESDEDVAWLEQVLPFVDELESLLSVDGFSAAGIDRESQFAMYGNGLLPIVRITLSDGDLMETTIQRLEEKAEQEMMTATIDGHSYRYAGDDEARVVLAILDQDLVLAFVPTGLPDEQFKQVLGLTLPQENIAEAGTLAKIASEYGYDHYMVGLFDVEQAVATFIEPQSGINAELLSMMDYDSAELDDVCKAEFKSVAGIMPRVVMGYTELTVERMVSNAVFELRDDLASAVAKLTAPVPGLGTLQSGLFSFGMSMDLLEMRNFYSANLDAMEEAPFLCEHLADLQDGIAAGREMLNQPIPPIVYGLKGFLVSVDNIEGMDLATQQPPTEIEMNMLVATENAEGLLAMGAMFSPELAALNLEPNGAPVKFNMPMVDALGQDIYLALSENALGISVGEGMQDGLGDLLKLEVTDRPPFFYAEMDAGAYYEFVGTSMMSDIGVTGDMPELEEAIASMNEASQKLMDRMSVSINFTDDGIEIDSAMTLHD